MEIKTKYNIRDRVWVLKDNKVIHGSISCINTHIKKTDGITYKKGITIEYNYEHVEENCFPTKEKLLETL